MVAIFLALHSIVQAICVNLYVVPLSLSLFLLHLDTLNIRPLSLTRLCSS